MKLLLILWAVGLTSCEKLDRTYLPPPGSITAGGRPGDLDLPLEFPKENYPSTFQPTDDDTNGDGPLRPNFPNVAFGIDRKGSPVSSVEPFTTGPVVSVSKNTFKVPTTTSYDFIQTSTLPSLEGFKTIGPVRTQEYPSKTFSVDSNSDYPQQSDTDFINTYVPGTVQLNENYGEKATGIPNSNPDFQKTRQFEVQPRIDDTSLGSKGFSNTDYPSTQYGDDIDSISGATIPTANSPYSDEYYDEEKFVSSKPSKVDQINSNQQYPGIKENVDGKNKYKDTYNPVSNLLPNQYTDKISSPTSADIQSFGYESTPKYSSTIDNMSPRYNVRTHPERVQAEADRNAVIINYENILTPEGFAYSFDTSNGIHADESGTAIDGVKAKGSYSYTGDDGKVYSIVYTADENGFLPRGDHLPTAPPVPDAILKVIEQAAINKQLGIIDDGSYDDAKYGHERYQGSIRRRPQSSNIIGKQSVNEENNFSSRQNENGPINVDNNFDKVYVGDKNGRPYSGKNSYSTEDEKQFLPDNGQINNNGVLISGQVQDVNVPVFKGSLMQSTDSSGLGEGNLDPSHPSNNQPLDKGYPEMTNRGYQNSVEPSQNSDEFPVTTPVTIIRKGYGQDINQPTHTGYEYKQPQNGFNGNNGNNFKSQLSTTNGEDDEIKPEDKVNNDGKTPKPFITPNVSFNFNSRKNDDAMVKRPLAKNTNRPMTSEDRASYTQNGNNDFVEPATSDDSDNDTIGLNDSDFSTRKPYESSSSNPLNYQTPYISKVVDNGRQRYNNYQTPTLRSQYDSTTPLPSEMSSRLTPSTNRRVYSQTTPTQYTTRPSISETYTTSSKPSNSRRTNGVRIPTRPDSSVRRTGYRGESGRNDDDRDYKHPTDQTGSQDDIRHGFGSSSRPNNFGSQSTTERVIAEDFSGPKQSQRFDPSRGYFY